jgi:hypothetical protein
MCYDVGMSILRRTLIVVGLIAMGSRWALNFMDELSQDLREHAQATSES